MEQLKLSPGKDLGEVVITFREPRVKDFVAIDAYKGSYQEVPARDKEGEVVKDKDGRVVMELVRPPTAVENLMTCVYLLEVDGKLQPREWWEERPVEFYRECLGFLRDRQVKEPEGEDGPLEPSTS